MAGIDRFTGRPLTGWANVEQKLRYLFVTRIGSRFMRRTVGSAVPAILGQSLSMATVLRWKTAIIVACELWEPRFAVTRVDSDEGDNDPERMRLGQLSLNIVGEYRPRAHLGDPTPEALERTLVVGRSAST